MNIIRQTYALLSIIVLTSTAAYAESILVRTGDHDTFTRLVIDFQERPDWNIVRSEKKYTLYTTAKNTSFSLDRAFARIGRERLSELRDLGNGHLELMTNCDCDISSIELPNQGLVIDIHDAAPTELNTPERRDPALTNQINDKKILPIVLSAEQTQSNYDIFHPDQTFSAPNTARLKNEKNQKHTLALEIDRKLNSNPNNAQKLKSVISVHSTELTGQEILSERGTDGIQDRLETNMQFTTQEIDGKRGDGISVPISPNDVCETNNLLTFVDQGGSRPTVEALAHARSALIDSRDHPSQTGYRELARLMIYFSLGAEAISLLNNSPDDTPDRRALFDMARIVNGSYPGTTGIFSDQFACNSATALWSVLSYSNVPKSASVNTDGLLQAFSELSIHLKDLFGPRLVEHFTGRHDIESALLIRNSMQRKQTYTNENTYLVDARLDQEASRTQSAEKNLDKVAEMRGEQSAQAMRKVIESRMNSGLPISMDRIEDASSVAYELTGTDASNLLFFVIGKALAYVEKFSDAIDFTKRTVKNGQLDRVQATEVYNLALIGLADKAEDPLFLSIALQEQDLFPLERATQLAIAERFTKLHLPKQARSSLAIGDRTPSVRERLILAEIALLERRREIAYSYLTGLSGQQAEQVEIRIDELMRKDVILTSDNRSNDETLRKPNVTRQSGSSLKQSELHLQESRDIRTTASRLMEASPNMPTP